MHLQPIVNSIESSLLAQNHGGDETVTAAVTQLVGALGPSLRIAAIELAEQAASEVRAQCPDLAVDLVLADGDPAIRIGDVPTAREPVDEELDARISLRLPPSLKATIDEAARSTGESVNTWILHVLAQHTQRSHQRGRRVRDSFDL